MTTDEQFKVACDKLLPRINSWEDIYLFFSETMENVVETMHPAMVFDALFTMYAFLIAMKELPEEGDIKVIAKRMLYILLYEGVEKLGAKITVVTEKEMAVEQAKALAIAAVLASLPDAESQDTTKTPRTLH